MGIHEIRQLTQCSIELHLEKSFFITLARPSDERMNLLRKRYKFSKLAFDDDRDLIGSEGSLEVSGVPGSVREVIVLSSREVAGATCFGQATHTALAVVEDVAKGAFDVVPEALKAATLYVTYKTTTKIRFGGPVVRLLGSTLQEQFARWMDVKNRSLAALIEKDAWPPVKPAVVHATAEYWEKYFGEGAPDHAFVVPADLDFFVYLPSRFFKMTKYRFRLTVESFEEFLDNEYYVTSEMPYTAHMALLENLNDAIVRK